ncbi:hypothetical protein AVEN_2830-1 [Araneus ventricosus]|uniref:Uncharacterized protein n=1 Tax=Araneus ventricosus TaxID=182803 RepID=A0A4Y2EJH7_ARAVE|nr:hypothetical protein AVEN_2830-1 [Araneus ventricosus]
MRTCHISKQGFASLHVSYWQQQALELQPYSQDFREKNLGFAIQPSSYSLKDLENSERSKLNMEEFNALDDLSGLIQDNPILPGEAPFIKDDDHALQVNNKKSNSKPKYDPAWKFMGLGKRPHSHRKEILTYDSSHQYDQSQSYDIGFPNDFDYSLDPDEEVNPLLTFSTLVNFEIFNAIRDGIAEATKKAVKNSEGILASKLYSGGDHGSERLGSPAGMYVGRQKAMYDPGWMLTGLGKR